VNTWRSCSYKYSISVQWNSY